MAYSALGYSYSMKVMGQNVGVDIPVEKWMQDAVKMAGSEASKQLPKLVQDQVMPILQKQVLPPLLKEVEGAFRRDIMPQVTAEIDRTISTVTWRAFALGGMLCGTIVVAAYWQKRGFPSKPKWLSRKKAAST